MDASAALAELLGLSTQVVEAVIVSAPTAPSRPRTRPSEERAQALAEAGGSLSSAAAAIRPSAPRGRARARRPRARLARRRARRRALDRRDDRRRADRRPRRVRPPGGAAPAAGGDGVKLVTARGRGARLWLVLRRRREDELRVVVAWEDGSELELRRRHAGARAARRDRRGCAPMTLVDDLGLRLLDVALLEGDFTLRSGKRSRWYLDKYRFETDPGLLRELGERLARCVRRGRAARPRGSPARRSERSHWPHRLPWRPECPSSSCAMKPRDTAPGTASRGRTSQVSSCASSRTSSRRAAPSVTRWRPFAQPGSSSGMRCVSSTGRRVARTRSPGSGCASPRSTVRATCWQRGTSSVNPHR